MFVNTHLIAKLKKRGAVPVFRNFVFQLNRFLRTANTQDWFGRCNKIKGFLELEDGVPERAIFSLKFDSPSALGPFLMSLTRILNLAQVESVPPVYTEESNLNQLAEPPEYEFTLNTTTTTTTNNNTALNSGPQALAQQHRAAIQNENARIAAVQHIPREKETYYPGDRSTISGGTDGAGEGSSSSAHHPSQPPTYNSDFYAIPYDGAQDQETHTQGSDDEAHSRSTRIDSGYVDDDLNCILSGDEMVEFALSVGAGEEYAHEIRYSSDEQSSSEEEQSSSEGMQSEAETETLQSESEMLRSKLRAKLAAIKRTRSGPDEFQGQYDHTQGGGGAKLSTRNTAGNAQTESNVNTHNRVGGKLSSRNTTTGNVQTELAFLQNTSEDKRTAAAGMKNSREMFENTDTGSEDQTLSSDSDVSDSETEGSGRPEYTSDAKLASGHKSTIQQVGDNAIAKQRVFAVVSPRGKESTRQPDHGNSMEHQYTNQATVVKPTQIQASTSAKQPLVKSHTAGEELRASVSDGSMDYQAGHGKVTSMRTTSGGESAQNVQSNDTNSTVQRKTSSPLVLLDSAIRSAPESQEDSGDSDTCEGAGGKGGVLGGLDTANALAVSTTNSNNVSTNYRSKAPSNLTASVSPRSLTANNTPRSSNTTSLTTNNTPKNSNTTTSPRGASAGTFNIGSCPIRRVSNGSCFSRSSPLSREHSLKSLDGIVHHHNSDHDRSGCESVPEDQHTIDSLLEFQNRCEIELSSEEDEVYAPSPTRRPDLRAAQDTETLRTTQSHTNSPRILSPMLGLRTQSTTKLVVARPRDARHNTARDKHRQVDSTDGLTRTPDTADKPTLRKVRSAGNMMDDSDVASVLLDSNGAGRTYTPDIQGRTTSTRGARPRAPTSTTSSPKNYLADKMSLVMGEKAGPDSKRLVVRCVSVSAAPDQLSQRPSSVRLTRKERDDRAGRYHNTKAELRSESSSSCRGLQRNDSGSTRRRDKRVQVMVKAIPSTTA